MAAPDPLVDRSDFPLAPRAPSIHGTFVSSGCIRLVNSDIEDLYTRVQVGARVVVLQSGKPPATAAN